MTCEGACEVPCEARARSDMCGERVKCHARRGCEVSCVGSV